MMIGVDGRAKTGIIAGMAKSGLTLFHKKLYLVTREVGFCHRLSSLLVGIVRFFPLRIVVSFTVLKCAWERFSHLYCLILKS